MLRLDKKGLHIGVVVTSVLIIFTFIGLFVLVRNFGDLASSSVDVETCRISVLQRAKFVIAEQNPFGVELQCPTSYINLLDNKDDKVKGEKNIFIEDEEDIKKVIANEMYDCWFKFGNGRVDFVGEGFNLAENKVCYICADIRISDKVLANPKVGREIKNFEIYLVNNDIPGRDLNYYEYLGGNLELANNENLELNIVIDKPLAVSYTIVDEGIWKSMLESFGYASPTFGASLLAGYGAAQFTPLGPVANVLGVISVGIFIASSPTASDKSAVMSVVPLEDVSGCARV